MLRERLRSALKEMLSSGIDQFDLAERLDVTLIDIQQFFNGSGDVRMLTEQSISQGIVNPIYLVTGEGDMLV